MGVWDVRKNFHHEEKTIKIFDYDTQELERGYAGMTEAEARR